MLLTKLWVPKDNSELRLEFMYPDSQVINVHGTSQDFSRVYRFWQERLNPTASTIPFDERAHVYLGASLPKLREILLDPSRPQPLRSYPGQGVQISFTSASPKNYIEAMPFLEEHLRRNPSDVTYFEYTIGEVCKKLADPNWSESQFFFGTFSQLLKEPTAQLKLLIDNFDDVFRFLMTARGWRSPIYQSYFECVEQDPEFSWRMALRTIDSHSGNSLDYVLFSGFPEEHRADVAECFCRMGPEYTAARVLEIAESEQLSSILHFVADRLPLSHWRAVFERWSEPVREQALREMCMRGYGLSKAVCQSMNADYMLRKMSRPGWPFREQHGNHNAVENAGPA